MNKLRDFINKLPPSINTPQKIIQLAKLTLFFLNLWIPLSIINDVYSKTFNLVGLATSFLSFGWILKKDLILEIKQSFLKAMEGNVYYVVILILVSANLVGVTYDPDQDNLGLYKEKILGTSPVSPDSDRDVMRDDLEVHNTKNEKLFNPNVWDINNNNIIDLCDLVAIHKLNNDNGFIPEFDISLHKGMTNVCRKIFSTEFFAKCRKNPKDLVIDNVNCEDILISKIPEVLGNNFTQYDEK